MDKASAIEFLLNHDGAPEFFSELEETDLWGTRLETTEGREHWDALAETGEIHRKNEEVYEISDFNDSSAEALLEGAEKIVESREKGLKVAHTEAYPSVQCGDCGSKWLQSNSGNALMAATDLPPQGT